LEQAAYKLEAHKFVEVGKYKDYTWHHHEDTKTMQLVPRKALNFDSPLEFLKTGRVAFQT
jgi:A nuclease of the HNH/ENDO VII superfamily with conserved WHH